MKKLKNIHPGEILQEEFLVPLGISAYRLSRDKKAQHKLYYDTDCFYFAINNSDRKSLYGFLSIRNNNKSYDRK